MPLRETTFIERNVDAWRRLEAELARSSPDPDKLRDLYAGISDDLSYARTHYPNRSVRSYLNNKAAELSLSLQRNERGGLGFVKFWTRTLPLELYEQRYVLLLALIIFLLAGAVGWGSSMVDPGFPELILGPEYVQMTRDNIAAGDPMAVYKDGSRLGGTLGIAGNNLRVALLCFVSGILIGLGTLLVLLYNGIMVGAFQQFFFAEGVGWESVVGIWTHGTIEIASIIVAAAAGLVLAKGIIWPGTLSRTRAFQLTALSGLRILAGTAPLIILAAIIEGYLTRLTHFPLALRIAFLAVNLLFVLYYYVLRPLQVGRGTQRDEHDYGRLPPDHGIDWQEHVIYATPQVFFTVLRFVSTQGLRYLGPCVLASVLVGFLWVTLAEDGLAYADYVQQVSLGPDLAALFKFLTPVSTLVAGGALLAFLSYLTYRLHLVLPGAPQRTRPTAAVLVGLLIPWLVLALAAWLHGALLLLLLPFCMTWMRGISHRDGKVGEGLGDAWKAVSRYILHTAALTVLLYGTQVFFVYVVDFLYYGFVYSFFLLNVPPWLNELARIDTLLIVISELTVFTFSAMLWVLGFGLLYHANLERSSASGLQRRLEQLFPTTA